MLAIPLRPEPILFPTLTTPRSRGRRGATLDAEPRIAALPSPPSLPREVLTKVHLLSRRTAFLQATRLRKTTTEVSRANAQASWSSIESALQPLVALRDLPTRAQSAGSLVVTLTDRALSAEYYSLLLVGRMDKTGTSPLPGEVMTITLQYHFASGEMRRASNGRKGYPATVLFELQLAP